MTGKDKKASKKSSSRSSGDIAHLLDDVRAGASIVEEGNFRLDWTRALDKVKRFQLTDPHRYVLELAQCAIAGGASQIEVRTDSDDVIVSYDAPVHTREQLLQLFDYLFSQDRQFAALKQLALAVNSALALEPRFITVDSGDGETGHRLRLTSHTDVTIAPLEAENLLTGTRVHVRDRLTWKILIEFFRTRTAEGKHLAEGCALAPIPVLLDGKDVVQPFASDALMSRPFSVGKGEKRVTGQVALPARARENAEIQILMNGVRVVTHEITDGWLSQIGVVGYFDCAELSRNASHSDVHRDKTFTRAMHAFTRAARTLLLNWLEERLLGEDRSWKENLDAFSTLERHYIDGAMRVLLRSYRRRLAAPIGALLDVPDVVELAVRRPRKSSLRAIWEAYGDERKLYVASRRFDVDLRDLPPGVVPIRGPYWVLDEVLRGKRESADDLLTIVENGLKNRREREARRREPMLNASEAIIKVPLSHEGHEIVGELGVRRPLVASDSIFDWLPGAQSKEGERDSFKTVVLFLQDGVPLGVRRIQTSLAHGVAVVDSAKFKANDAWDDLQPNGASKSIGAVLKRAIPRLLAAMSENFAQLPPPKGMREQGYFSEEGYQLQQPGELSALWPTDTLARDIRIHVDTILERHRKPERKKTPWLWTWQLFHTMSGEPVSMAQILGEEPLGDGTCVPLSTWRYVVDQSWGIGAREDLVYLNLSARQRDIIVRYIGRGLRDGSVELGVQRMQIERAREQALQYQRNLNAARMRRQSATLDPRYYVAVLPLELDGLQGVEDGAAVGAVGIPSFGGPPGHVRFLIDDLPLPDIEFTHALPVHAVVRSSGIQPNATFEGVSLDSRAHQLELFAAIADHVPALMAELARQADGKPPSGRGHMLIWTYLADRKPHKGEGLPRLPDELLDLPLFPTVDRGPLNLRQVHADARAHKNAVLVTSRSLGRQLQKRPILVLSGDQQRVVRRLLGVRVRDYTRSLQTEEDVLARLDQPRREPVLGDAAALTVTIDEDGIRGQIGIARFTHGPSGKEQARWLDLMAEGIVVERESFTVDDAPIIGVVEGDKLQPNRLWDSMRRNAGYKRVKRVATEAAERLFLHACQRIADEPFMYRDTAPVVECLRALAARRFQGMPELHLDEASEVDRALAEAPLWTSADVGNRRHSLVDISGQWNRTGVCWVVSVERGHLHDERVVIVGDDSVKAALGEIYGDRVRDGARVVRRDDAAHQRRMNAPNLDAQIPPALMMAGVYVEQSFDRIGLSIAGQVALYREYRAAEPGISMVIGLDGRVLCRRTCKHALRGFAYIDCKGLRPNRDWDGMGDSRQTLAIDGEVRKALWQVAELVIGEDVTLHQQSSADLHRRAMFLDALQGLTRPGANEPGRAAVAETLSAVPMFYTVTGHAMSLAELRAHVDQHGTLRAIADDLERGPNPDGMVIVRADETTLGLLREWFGSALERYDDRYSKLLEGYKRRQQAVRVEPHLSSEVVTKIFVEKDSTTMLIGLVRPGGGKDSDKDKKRKGKKRKDSGKSVGHGDNSDATSAVHIHIDHRKVTRKLQTWHPCFEVWVNDDRLTPSADFRNVEADDEYWRVLTTIREQLPEVLARAVEMCVAYPDPALRMRLCHYVMDHRQRLWMRAKTDSAGPEARLLGEKIWPCLTSAGREMHSTRTLLEAHDNDQLVIVDGEAPGTAIESGLVAVRVAAVERRLLKRTFGKLRDYTDTLHTMVAHRQFMRAAPVAELDLRAVSIEDGILWQRPLDELGWQGEIGVSALDARGIEVRVFHEHRPIAIRQLPAPVRAVCVAQWASLQPSPDYDGIVDDDHAEAFDRAIERALWDALGDLSGNLDSLEGRWRECAENVILTALSSYGETGGPGKKKANTKSGRRDPASARPLATMLKRLRAAPLLIDTMDRTWSIADLRSEYGNREIATIEPQTAQVGLGLEDQLVLVVGREEFKTIARMLRIMRHDQRYLESVETRRRMEGAPTTFSMPRGVMVAAGFDDGVLKGELALSTTVDHGALALFSSGRQVEIRPMPALPGLQGYVDGHLATDEAFTRVELERDQNRRIAAAYDERLQAAVSAAVDYRGRRSSRTWRALRRYVCVYLQRHLDDIGQALAERQERVLLDHRAIPRMVRKALTCPIFERDDGEYVDTATLLGAERPVVVRAPTVKKRRGKDPAVLLLGGLAEVSLLTSLLGAREVFAYEDWLESEKRAAEKARKQSERKQALAVAHLSTRLKLTLREAINERPQAGVRIAQIAAIAAEARGKAPLAERVEGDGHAVINSDHKVWKRAAADIRQAPSCAIYLASAVVTGLALQPGTIDDIDALELLTGLAQYAARAAAKQGEQPAGEKDES